jgi:broad specificity phosphatase PhoE
VSAPLGPRRPPGEGRPTFGRGASDGPGGDRGSAGGPDAPGPARLVVARHGATQWSALGRHTGRTDVPLSDQGRRQAEELGRRLDGHDFSRVLVSPLQRAVETCAIAGFGERAELCPELREWDYGDYEGRTTPDIRAQRPGWWLWADGVPDGELLSDVVGRVDRVLSMVRAGSGDVLAFAHAHVLRVLAARWMGLDGADGGHLTLGPATLSVLGWEREVPVMVRWNDAAGDALE